MNAFVVHNQRRPTPAAQGLAVERFDGKRAVRA
jgi:hypothetical protein